MICWGQVFGVYRFGVVGCRGLGLQVSMGLVSREGSQGIQCFMSEAA